VAAALASDRGFASNVGVIDADKVEMLERALVLLPSDDSERALVLASLCAELTYGSSLERRQALADEAIAIAESSGDDAVMVRVVNHVGYPLHVPPLLEQSLAWSADALLRAERLGDPVLLLWAASGRALAAGHAGDIDEMDRCLEIGGARAEQLDQPQLNWWRGYAFAMRAQIAGNTEAAEQFATEAFEVGTASGQPDAALFFGAQLMVVSSQRGRLAELMPFIERMTFETPAIAPGIAAAMLAQVNVAIDRTDEARHVLEEFAAGNFDLPLDPLWLSGMLVYAQAAVGIGDPKYAGPLFDRLAPWAEQFSTTGVTADGPVSYYLGDLATVLGRFDEADAYFMQAAAFNDRVDAKFFAASTNLAWGEMLAERGAPGDAEQSRELLTNAHAVGAAHGYASVERRAAEALQRLD
jgi:ATP/maltotriose-dependent transcriptional regulator MalT